MHVFKCNVSLICSVTFLEDQFFNFILWQIFAYAVVRCRHKDNLICDFKKDHVLVQNIYFGFILHHVETQSRAVVTGLAAFSPVTPPPSPPPADVTVRSETCKVNMNLLFLHFTIHSIWDICGSGIEPVSRYRMVAGSIPLICMSKWIPKLVLMRNLTWKPTPLVNVCMNYWESLWTKASAKLKCKYTHAPHPYCYVFILHTLAWQ